MLIFGVKYTKERLKKLGITISYSQELDTWSPLLIIENLDGSFMRYPTTMIDLKEDSTVIDDAIDRFLVELRKEKLQKLNEIQT